MILQVGVVKGGKPENMGNYAKYHRELILNMDNPRTKWRFIAGKDI